MCCDISWFSLVLISLLFVHHNNYNYNLTKPCITDWCIIPQLYHFWNWSIVEYNVHEEGGRGACMWVNTGGWRSAASQWAFVWSPLSTQPGQRFWPKFVNECSWSVSICSWSASGRRFCPEFALAILGRPWPGPTKILCPCGYCGPCTKES